MVSKTFGEIYQDNTTSKIKIQKVFKIWTTVTAEILTRAYRCQSSKISIAIKNHLQNFGNITMPMFSPCPNKLYTYQKLKYISYKSLFESDNLDYQNDFIK